MVTSSLKSYGDDDIINLINSIVMGELEADIGDLKAVLAEASTRKLEKKYINMLADKIKDKLEGQKETQAPQKRAVRQEKAPAAPAAPAAQEQEEYEEDYPVLSFLSGLFRVFAWIMLIGTLAAGACVSFLMFKEEPLMITLVMLAAVVLGIVLMLWFYARSERIRLQLDIEYHLRMLQERQTR